MTRIKEKIDFEIPGKVKTWFFFPQLSFQNDIRDLSDTKKWKVFMQVYQKILMKLFRGHS